MVKAKKKRAVFLDRDGVLNSAILVDGLPRAPTKISQIHILDDAASSVQKLKLSDYIVVTITNQPDVARGVADINDMKFINDTISRSVGVDHSYICFHDDLDRCYCRKPNPGNIFKAAIDLNLDLDGSFMVGDRWRDIEAGYKAGCECFFINYLYRERKPTAPYTEVSCLSEAVDLILEGSCS